MERIRKGFYMHVMFYVLTFVVFHFCVKSWETRGMPIPIPNSFRKPCKPLLRSTTNYVLLTFVLFLIAAGVVTRLMPEPRMSIWEHAVVYALLLHGVISLSKMSGRIIAENEGTLIDDF